MMIAHKGLRSFNICIWDAICVPFCVFNNKINGKFISTDINGRSLDAISKSGWYTGANISELTSVFGDYFFKLFALVQHNNSKSIHGISSNGDVFDIYQTSSGTYNIYQTALKSDLNKATFLGSSNNFHDALSSIVSQGNAYSIIIFNTPMDNPFTPYGIEGGMMIATHAPSYWKNTIIFLMFSGTNVFVGSYKTSDKTMVSFKKFSGIDTPLATQ